MLLGQHGAVHGCSLRSSCDSAAGARLLTAPSTVRTHHSHRQGRRKRQPCQCPRSLNVQGPGSSAQPADPLQGQVTTELIQRMRQSISDALDTQTVEVVDVSGDGRHVGIDVVAQAFEGLSSVKRQRLVYKAIWQELMETVHAVDAMTTKTPAEAGQ